MTTGRTTIVPIALALCGLALAGFADRPARAGPMRHTTPSPFYYTEPPDILRAQRALERLGLLKRDQYSPGAYDDATHGALWTYQADHFLVRSGWIDFDTFAMLPTDERPDADGDGVPDAEDRCPATPRTDGKKTRVRVGHDGCPIVDQTSAAPSDRR